MSNFQNSFDANVCIHTIREILAFNYIIPNYQRRYRWDSSGEDVNKSIQQLGLQVDDLIRDIKEYSESAEHERDEFYYLQPIVVAPNESKFELIDGQQRITTIIILLKSLMKIHSDLRGIKLGITEYGDKKRTQIIDCFFENLNEDELDNINIDNIDEYYILKAIKTAISTFIEKNLDYKRITETLLDKTCVIWYQVPRNDGNKLFTRLNTGKIPLTNAELIKALILQKKNFKNDHDLSQIKIATEWDCIESDLHDEKLWYFIPHKSSRNFSRIDVIFDLYCKYIMTEDEATQSNQDDLLYTFNKFALAIKNSGDPIKLWNNVRAFFLKLKEWSNDPRKHGLIGFILHEVKEESILKEDKNFNFVESVRKIYLDKYLGKDKDIDLYSKDLNFDNRQGVKSFLLLANICACIKDNIFFPFKEYITNPPDIEHIASVTDNNMEKREDQEKFLNSISNIWKEFRGDIKNLFRDNSDDILELPRILELQPIKEIDEYFPLDNAHISWMKDDEDNAKKFKACYDTISKHPILGEYVSKLSDESKSKIGNLALLSKSINRGYGNALFIEKQKTIIETKEYIYPITKNAFIKNFALKNNPISRSTGKVKWVDTDLENNREYMLELIKDVLKINHE